MATTFTGNISLAIQTVLRNALDLSNPVDAVNALYQFSIANGAGAGACNQLWHDRRTLAASAGENLDMAGVLTNNYGTTIAFARIKLIIVYNASAVAEIRFGPATTNGLTTMFPGTATHGIFIRPGGVNINYAPDATGFVVTASSVDVLRVLNISGSDSATYDILIAGALT